jgi:CubicO group peptidase (beta-lactamase class C family)
MNRSYESAGTAKLLTRAIYFQRWRGETPGIDDHVQQLDALVSESAFSGVVRVDRGDRVELAKAYGLANRADELSNELDTRFAIASGTKGLTALAVMVLVEDGTLALGTAARSFLGDDLPLIGDDVTVEHLLAHRSGIGDYVDEESGVDVTDHVLPVPVFALATTEQYLAVLERHPPKFAPGERFAYCNSGYVVLALVAERASGVPFHELVVRRVCEPAGMSSTAFLRSDELPEKTALGYLAADGLRTNVFHLPVRGSGDGGVYTTAADVRALWTALFAGRIVSAGSVDEMVRPRSDAPSEKRRYGLGFWLHESTKTVILEGYDAGVSFRSLHDRDRDLTCTVISNWTDGVWPIGRFLAESLQI